MSGGPTDSGMTTIGLQDPTESVFIRVLARVSTILTPSLFRSLFGYQPPPWDGTDPLLGGHRDASDASRTMVGGSRGGRL